MKKKIRNTFLSQEIQKKPLGSNREREIQLLKRCITMHEVISMGIGSQAM
nr:MAG TPA: hypothetical protein [Caudoviricetes sp.]